VRWLHLGLLAGVAVLGALAILWLLPATGVNVLKPYQNARLTGFTHPDDDPRGATYNLRQSITAVGAGGLRGRGILGATQTRLNYLPEHSTDFAFASLAEEHGFFGATILLLLYLLVVWRALKVVAAARDLYCAIVAGGIAVMFLFQVFVNSAMAMGIAPITGIPLPFVSVGGSSMLTLFLAVGVLQAIHARRNLRRRQ
jgi:rod shape determining protein RodA